MTDTWYIAINGAQVGPLTLQELKDTLVTFAKAIPINNCYDYDGRGLIV
jgi:hypothetical protein